MISKWMKLTESCSDFSFVSTYPFRSQYVLTSKRLIKIRNVHIFGYNLYKGLALSQRIASTYWDSSSSFFTSFPAKFLAHSSVVINHLEYPRLGLSSAGDHHLNIILKSLGATLHIPILYCFGLFFDVQKLVSSNVHSQWPFVFIFGERFLNVDISFSALFISKIFWGIHSSGIIFQWT